MLVPDVNILVHAYNKESPSHAAARKWLEQTLTLPRPVGLPWAVMLGFIRIVTNRRVVENPVHTSDAVSAVQSWLRHPRIQILSPGEHHAEILFDLLNRLGTAGNLATDAHLAALAIEYQAEIVSTDADFSRFPGLRWFNPLKTSRK